MFYLGLGLVLMWLAGLFYFIYDLSQVKPPMNMKTDGIVVLTGGNSRLQEAVRLLENGLADRLFISGVNAEVPVAELYAALGISKNMLTAVSKAARKQKIPSAMRKKYPGG